MAHSPLRRSLRTLLAVVALVSLVGACSSGDDDDDSAETTSTRGAPAPESLVEDPCDLLDAADLAEITGVTFDQATPGVNSCNYTSSAGQALISLNFTALGDSPADLALETSAASCDQGTKVELEFTAADGGFGCLVDGVATVAATGEGMLALLLGATLQEDVSPEDILQDLATILERALAET